MHSEEDAVSVSESDFAPAPVEERAQDVGTRAWPVDNNQINVWLCRHKGYRGPAHEIWWQVDDAYRAIGDINPHANMRFRLIDTDFVAEWDAHSTLRRFREYIAKNSEDNSKPYGGRYGRDLFSLVSYYNYYNNYNNMIAGSAYLGTYQRGSSYNWMPLVLLQ